MVPEPEDSDAEKDGDSGTEVPPRLLEVEAAAAKGERQLAAVEAAMQHLREDHTQLVKQVNRLRKERAEEEEHGKDVETQFRADLEMSETRCNRLLQTLEAISTSSGAPERVTEVVKVRQDVVVAQSKLNRAHNATTQQLADFEEHLEGVLLEAANTAGDWHAAAAQSLLACADLEQSEDVALVRCKLATAQLEAVELDRSEAQLAVGLQQQLSLLGTEFAKCSETSAAQVISVISEEIDQLLSLHQQLEEASETFKNPSTARIKVRTKQARADQKEANTLAGEVSFLEQELHQVCSLHQVAKDEIDRLTTKLNKESETYHEF